MFDQSNDPICIAHRSTRGEGAFRKSRWVELSVYFLRRPLFGVGHYVATVEKLSDRDGERDNAIRWGGQQLEEVLEHIDDSAPGRAVKHMARDWDEANGIALRRAASGDEVASDDDAIRMLYGADAPGARGTTARLARDFGLGESTVRMARSNGRAIKVPLTAVVALLDRARLPSVRAEGEER